ncbi:HEAT repeat domain-containing protein [Silvibacterium dinghuense]|uniref:Putative zinc-finger domain-containing protein n=1 Tax=Silvibacterium dinghuense TaxID=1560006 RepID=A0A4Q1SL72_9BACT|nr:HEAT repeat domain-containing protein [Silvibacterium dinghuense]RXS98203.1 hypothetical protein ESZ00_07030 [Silvibacterium dinghuense]GGH00627.1 hypothetical protein GCM10011586_15260 [Silvibacterium dinghuense]
MTMKCDAAQEQIALAVYGELADDQKHQLEQHLGVCEACRDELEGAQALMRAMALLPVEDPTPNFVARTRMRLEEALDAMPQGGWVLRVSQQFSRGVHRLRSAPVAASLLLIAGVGTGAYGGYHAGLRAHVTTPVMAATQAPAAGTTVAPETITAEPAGEESADNVASVNGILAEPGTGNVEVHYNRLVPASVHGSLNDPGIRQLLVIGAKNRVDADVRNNSVGLLANGCRTGQMCSDRLVRNELMVSLLYDDSSRVRLEALDGLQSFVADDMKVRDAVLEALMRDPSAEVRARAVELLEPVGADSSVREVLHTVAVRDDNPQIRGVSQQVLSQIEQVQ